MRKIFILFAAFLLSAPVWGQEFEAVRQIAQRQFPWIAPHLTFEQIPSKQGKDVFELSTTSKELLIKANSPVAAARGLDFYLKKYAHQSLSHMGDQVRALNYLPQIKEPIRRQSEVDYRYALNYVTINYSYAFYTWKEWEREIDWMALNGVNLLLVPVGTELVWYNTLVRLGCTDEQARKFIPGPGFTAWWLMGNLEGWGGMMSLNALKQQAELEKKILQRMKELGMEPILQGFYGMVPHDLKEQLPTFADAQIADQGGWPGNEFTRPGILLPGTHHFTEMADVYYEELKKLYGSDIRFFGGEPFHEGGKSGNVEVSRVAAEIQQVMQKHFPKSTWVLQGWQNNPSDAILNGIDKTKALVIELFGENTANWERRKGYEGTPFVWAAVNNFGEKTGLFGKLQRFADEVFRIKESPYAGGLKGIGIIPEGILNNPVVYDFMLDLAWQDTKPNLNSWLKYYTTYRYGKEDLRITKAWDLFLQTVYSSPEVYQEGPSEDIFGARPAIDVHSVSSWGTMTRNYDQAEFKEGVRLFVSAQKGFKNNETYQADKIDFLRQVLSNEGSILYQNLNEAVKHKDPEAIQMAGTAMLEGIRMQDDLLSYSPYFSLNKWLEQARNFSHHLSKEDQAKALFNAKAQITIWGPDNQPRTSLRDYAYKEWSGLMGTLYYDRWNRFIEGALKDQIPSAEDFYYQELEWARTPFSETKYNNRMSEKQLEKLILK